MGKQKGLGKGLDALFFDNAAPVSSVGAETLRISEIEPNRNQPRKVFEDEPLQQLADSIREHGLIQPLLVRPLQSGGYQIIAGERRWRASRMAGLTEVPVIVRDVDDITTMELALIENLQRENLNPMEEALGYKELMSTYGMTQADVSKSVGKSRSAVANILRLLNLPQQVAEYVKTGELSSGHARALLAFEGEEKIRELAQKAVKQGLTVRELERLSKQAERERQEETVVGFDPDGDKKERIKPRDSYYTEVELSLKEVMGRKVKVQGGEENDKGVLELTFYDKNDLMQLVAQMSKLF